MGFDPEELGGDAQDWSSISETVDSVVDAAAQPVSDDEDYARGADEVERRLGMAALYNEVLKSPIFTDDSALTREVQAEFEAFARERRAALLGIEAPKRAADFAPAEVAALRALATLDPQDVAVLALLCAATRKRMTAEGKQLPPPAASVPPKPARPTVRPRAVPQALRQPQRQELPKPVQKTETKPTRPTAAPPQPGKPPTRSKKVQSIADVPGDGAEFTDEAGRVCVARWVDIPTDEYGAKAQKVIEELNAGAAVLLPNGITVFNDGGAVKKLVSKQKRQNAKPLPGAVAFPSNISLVTAHQTDVALQIAGGDRAATAAANAAMKT